MTIEADIVNGLFGHLNGLDLGLPIAWPNVEFDPEGRAYARVTHLPARTAAFAIESTGSNQHNGLLQVDVFWPKGEGIELPAIKAALIEARFRRTTIIREQTASIRIVDPPYTSPAREDPAWVTLSVSIPYVAHAANPASA